MRLPKSWLTSLTYGVSPQPAQAPLNSKYGIRNCEPLTVFASVPPMTLSGSERKNSTFSSWPAARSSGVWVRWIAFSLTGQVSTQTPQPVQSSMKTCRRYLRPSSFLTGGFASTVLKEAGAPARFAGSISFERIAACGHAITHWLHWMQAAESHFGTDGAIPRFSNFEVAVGIEPS